MLCMHAIVLAKCFTLLCCELIELTEPKDDDEILRMTRKSHVERRQPRAIFFLHIERTFKLNKKKQQTTLTFCSPL